MLKITAVLERMAHCLEPRDYIIKKIITLPGKDFDNFCANLLADYDFIKENNNLMGHDKDASHCLLVLGENRPHGVLVNSEGYDYARYSSCLPNAAGWLRTQELEQRMETLDIIVGALSAHFDSNELRQILHDSCGMTDTEIEEAGFDLSEDVEQEQTLVIQLE